MGGTKTTLQWDNAPSHVSTKALEFYEKNKIERIEWPAKSPDLNPIENIWAIVKRKLEKRKVTKQAEIIENIQEIWKKNWIKRSLEIALIQLQVESWSEFN